MLHDSSDEDEGGGGAVNKKVGNNVSSTCPCSQKQNQIHRKFSFSHLLIVQ